jgi:hypothetical protein
MGNSEDYRYWSEARRFRKGNISVSQEEEEGTREEGERSEFSSDSIPLDFENYRSSRRRHHEQVEGKR